MHGRRLAGRYRLVDVIGSGGAGTVWTAVDEVLGRRVAVKDVLVPPWLDEQEQQSLRERTLREAQAVARIGQHPNVVTVYDVVEEDDRPWIVMQLVPARSLAQILDEDGPRTPHETAEIGLQVLRALHAAHTNGVLHRDVKPSNVLVDPAGNAVLTDFGIATMAGQAGLTGTNVLIGAPAYIAPERIRGQPAVPESDIWSLGAMLYSAVEGRPPYQRDNALCTMAATVEQDPDPPQQAGPLAPVLALLLQRDPAQRPTLTQVRGLLLTVAATGQQAVDQTAPTAELDQPGQRRQRLPYTVMATAAAGVAAVLAVLLTLDPTVPGSPSQQQRENPGPVLPSPVPAAPTAGDRSSQAPAARSVTGQPTGTGPAQPSAAPPATSAPAEPAPTGTSEPASASPTGSTPADPSPSVTVSAAATSALP